MPRVSDEAPELDARVGVEQAYRAHGAEVYRIALRFGRGDRAWAEDVTHEVFLELHAEWNAVREPQRVAGWLYRATVNRSLNRLRRRRLWDQPWVKWMVAGWRPSTPDPERIELGRAELTALLERVAALPDKQRVVFCMRHFDERPQTEIAQLVGHSESYVSKLLARAEAAIRPPEGSDP